MATKKTSPLVWILVAIAGVFVLGGVVLVGLGFFVAHKVKQAGIDPELMQRNPGLNAEYKFLLKDSPNFIGVAKGEDKLRAKVNEIIGAAKAAGDLDKLAQKWLGRPAGELPQ